MFGQKNKTDKVVSVDFGDKKIKIFIFKKERKGLSLINFRKIEKYDEGGNIKEEALLVDDLRKIAKDLSFGKKEVRVSISSNEAIVRYLEVPIMTLKELKNSVKYQAEMYVPFDLSGAYYDCDILKGTASSNKKMKIVFVAIKRNKVSELLRLFEGVGIKPAALEINSITLINSLAYLYRGKFAKDVIAIVDIGDQKISTNILSEGGPLLSRETDLGKSGINSNIVKGLGCSWDESETLKFMRDMSVESYIVTYFDRISKEIKSTFDFFEGGEQKKIKKIFLGGSNSNINGIEEYLQKITNVEVENLELKLRKQISIAADVEGIENIPLSVGVGLAAFD